MVRLKTLEEWAEEAGVLFLTSFGSEDLEKLISLSEFKAYLSDTAFEIDFEKFEEFILSNERMKFLR